jgi:probable rRNA maturation factor
MIVTESDVSEEWDSRTGWAALADQAVRSAVAASRHAGLIETGLTAELSVKFSCDAEVRALNAAYRHRDRATNVLSFPMVEPDLIGSIERADNGEVLLGDVVLAHGVCAAEAEERGIAIGDHATHLVVHGVLHLLGYDHETGDADADAMEAVERTALAALGIADPYAERMRSYSDGR